MTATEFSFSKEGYLAFIKQIIKRGYTFSKYCQPYSDLTILLRHDIDFSIDRAFEIAKMEADIGISSTFFFLIRQPVYNPFCSSNADKIFKIADMGHDISIHFDPTLYDNPIDGLKKEIDLWYSLFKQEVRIISIHKPSESWLYNDDKLIELGIETTYDKRYMDEFKYFADSNCHWKYGNPIDSKYFIEGRGMQILIHPIWWMTKSSSPIEKIWEVHRAYRSEFTTYAYNTVRCFREWMETS